MSEQKTLWDDDGSPSSQVPAAGKKPSRSRVGRKKEESGASPAPAPHSPPQGKRKPAQDAVERTLSLALDELATSYAAYAATHGLPIKDTSGPKHGVSCGTADLITSWVSRYREAMESFGSPEYKLAWSCWTTVFGHVIPRRVASALPTDARDYSGGLFGTTGWPSPRAEESYQGDAAMKDWLEAGGTQSKTRTNRQGEKVEREGGGSYDVTLSTVVVGALAGWPTPMAGAEKTEENNAAGNSDYSRAVEETAPISGWPTTQQRDGDSRGATESRATGERMNLDDYVQLAAPISGWQTPTVVDSTGRDYVYPSGDHSKPFLTLPGQAMLCDQEAIPTGWVTPACRDYKDGEGSEEYQERRADRPKGNPLGLEVRGAIPESSTAATGRTGALVLRPGFSLWLMLGRDAQKWLNSSPFFSSAEQIRSWLSDFYASRPATEPES